MRLFALGEAGLHAVAHKGAQMGRKRDLTTPDPTWAAMSVSVYWQWWDGWGRHPLGPITCGEPWHFPDRSQCPGWTSSCGSYDCRTQLQQTIREFQRIRFFTHKPRRICGMPNCHTPRSQVEREEGRKTWVSWICGFKMDVFGVDASAMKSLMPGT